jgi:predicted DNA-binding WGR domain protein
MPPREYRSLPDMIPAGLGRDGPVEHPTTTDTLCVVVYQEPPRPRPRRRFALAMARRLRYTSRDTMPRRRRPPCPAPVQLPLFAEAAPLIRVRPERNEWRFYRMEVWPDLSGRALLLRQWGRIGTEGRRRLDPHPDPGAAINALARLAGQKRRRGYWDRAQ